jgi:hypothetical protein
VARFQRDFDGVRPGDPAKAASLIMTLQSSSSRRCGLLLGSDAVHLLEENDLRRMGDVGKRRDWPDYTSKCSGRIGTRRIRLPVA